MHPYGSLWVLIGLYASLWFSNRSLLVFMRPFVYFCVLIDLYALLWVLVGPNWSLSVLMCPYGSSCVLRLAYGS